MYFSKKIASCKDGREPSMQKAGMKTQEDYRISMNQGLGFYFFQDVAFKRDRPFISGTELISYRLFQSMVDLQRSLIVAHLRGF